MIKCASAFVFAALCLCAAARDLPGRIYVYAEPTTSPSRYAIVCDGNRVAQLTEGAFVAIKVKPGRHTLAVEGGTPRSVDVPAGDEVFFRLTYLFQDGSLVLVLSGVGPERARREMRQLRRPAASVR